MMRSLPILLVLGLLLSIFAVHPVHGQTAKELLDSGQLIVRTRIEPEGPVLVGQKTILWVEILTSTWFTSAPQLPQTLEIPNAVVKMPDTFGSNRTERIGGATYAGQARRYLIYPQGPGQFDTPVVPLTLTVALESGGSSPQLSLEAPAQRFEARRPPGSEGLGLVLAAPGMQFNEQWDPEPGELKVGEAITRTVTVTIDDAVGMLLPPLEMKAVEGVSLYPGKPEINDKSNRGQLTGSRSDSATLVMEVEGTYHLPEVVYHWWDLERSELRKEVLPAVTLTVVPNPDLAAEHLGEKPVEESAEPAVITEEEDGEVGWWITGLALAAFILIRFFGRRLARLWAAGVEYRRLRVHSEARYFERFRQATTTEDPAVTMAALMAWLDRATASGATTLQQFVEQSRDPMFAAQAAALSHALYGVPAAAQGDEPRETWSGRRFFRLAARARKKLLSERGDGELTRAALPPLNPGAGGKK